MPATTTLTAIMKLTGVVTPGAEFIGSDNNTVTVSGLDSTQVLTSATTPPITKTANGYATLSAGAKTLSLRALQGISADEVIDGNGLKVQAIMFYNPTGNGTMALTEGAANGHPTFGASFLITLIAGQSIMLVNRAVDVGTDVAAADLAIDVAGTGSQILHYTLYLG